MPLPPSRTISRANTTRAPLTRSCAANCYWVSCCSTATRPQGLLCSQNLIHARQAVSACGWTRSTCAPHFAARDLARSCSPMPKRWVQNGCALKSCPTTNARSGCIARSAIPPCNIGRWSKNSDAFLDIETRRGQSERTARGVLLYENIVIWYKFSWHVPLFCDQIISAMPQKNETQTARHSAP